MNTLMLVYIFRSYDSLWLMHTLHNAALLKSVDECQ